MSNQKGQHFLLSSGSRTLSLKEIFKMTDKQAFETFKKFRWKDTDGIPVCPHCGLVDHHWVLASKQFRCKSCKKKFSITSGTIFAHRNYLYRII